MARRTYRMRRRGELAEETRQRIVDAVSRLHSERGIAETSMKQIAARAGVSIGAVYHHFPTYDDAIRACAAHTDEHVPLPAPDILDGLSSPAERIDRLVHVLCHYYECLPVLARVRCDAEKFASLRQYLDELNDRIRVLVSAALRPAPGHKGRVGTVTALVDFAVFQALRRNGLTAKQAAARMTEVILAWLAATEATPGRRAMPKKGS